MSLLDPPPVTSHKSRPLAFTIAAFVLVAIVSLWWTFRFYPEKRAVANFFDAVVAGDTARPTNSGSPNLATKWKIFSPTGAPTATSDR